eukprot:snap_masked-scaffold_142-processed-gene-0.3-mRNA-1 protein AED:0.34 eAED:1.00 QI:0/0/0/1/1/1/2/0/80
MFRTSINHLGYWCVLTFLHFLTVDLLVDGVVAGAARGTSRAVEDNQNVYTVKKPLAIGNQLETKYYTILGVFRFLSLSNC